VSEKQGTFSLKKCIEKHGEEIGKKIWTERQEKWMKANKKTNFSKISQDLFWKIVGREPLLLENCRFATNSNGEKDLSGANHEFTINLESMIIKPDFILVSKNRIIEFDGEYWHSEKSCGTRSSKRIWNPDRESKKESEMLKMGYELLRVGEREYMNSPETIIQKCLQFLNG
jgi:very-short-patch-repair endonuclease